MSLWAAAFEIFVVDGLFQIDAVDVGEGAEPGEDVGEFFFAVFLIGGVEGGGEFADFLHEPAEGGPCAAFGVAVAIAGEDVFLEFVDGHGVLPLGVLLNSSSSV